MSFTLHLGDCLEILRFLPDDSIDSVVTDPPYGIRFMGKSWDGADIEAHATYRASMPSHADACGPNGGHRSIAAEAGKYDLTPAGMRAFQSFTLEWASECLRVLKPGGHLLSFAAARTYHHMAVPVSLGHAGGVVLDPFIGSGSTGKAAIREGFQFIGCELDQSYMAIAKNRIEHELAKSMKADASAHKS
ncbi:DNA methyltransferase [Pseudomonas capsici]|uniref:DNA methyltransferase n=1 Tax=Pseudomonas capsici TaxID=2810614 RepID=UPI0021F0DD32|nr:DNA methyltransferase [Pseudomonas capsici]MCV4283194.1 DNA methyltransferase [Pseudomonas capsici]